MDVAFLDTAALLKLYLPEIGSSWLSNYIRNKQVVISELAIIESITALRFSAQTGRFTKVEAAKIFSKISQDRQNYEIIAISGEVFAKRIAVLAFNVFGTAALQLRAMDSIQLAAAIEARDIANRLTPVPNFVFVTADRKFLPTVKAAGFVTENPEEHP